MTGCLYVIATPIGNLGDISPRALEVLRSVDLVLAEDTRHSGQLFKHYGIEKPVLSFHKFNEKSRAHEVIERLKSDGISVAIVSDAGTPCISDPGVEIVRMARESGVPVYGVSGPSAIATAVSVSGLPSREFVFLGFLPRSVGNLRKALARARDSGIPTFVVYESPKRIKGLAAAILREIPEALVCFCCELTKIHERSYYGPISEVVSALNADPYAERGEYTVVAHVRRPEKDDGASHEPGAKSDSRVGSATPGVGVAIPGTIETAAGLRAAIPGGVGMPLESLLVKAMVERACTLKEAVSVVIEETGRQRNEVYQASLRLKTILRSKNP